VRGHIDILLVSPLSPAPRLTLADAALALGAPAGVAGGAAKAAVTVKSGAVAAKVLTAAKTVKATAFTAKAAAAAKAAPAAPAAAATAASALAVATSPEQQARYSGWLSVVADPLEDVMLKLQNRLRSVGVPFPQGTSIVFLTAMVKLFTFPFTKKQIESGMAMQNLQPQVKALRERWPGDENSQRLSKELNALYDRYGVSPLAGCVPTLLTLPVFWGLYRALINGSVDGAFVEPFWWVPSLAGPVYDKFPGNTGGISWLWPLNETGEPPIGWHSAQLYLILPVVLVVSQYVSSVLLPPTPVDSSDEESESAKNTKVLLKVLPLMVGYFSLTLPAGMGLYWLANNVFTTATTYYLKEMGGAQVAVPKLEKPKLKLGTAIRSAGASAASEQPDMAAEASVPAEAVAPLSAVASEQREVQEPAVTPPVAAAVAAAAPPLLVPRRSKRLKDAALRKTVSNPRGTTRLSV